MGLSQIVLGVVLLVFGRRLFWLFVAIVGFLVGMEFAGVMLIDTPQWVLLAIGAGCGLLGAVLAVFAERVAFSLAGFYAGSYLALAVAQSFSADGNSMIVFIIGGVIGALFAVMVMDWAIIILSCLVGAGAIVQALDLGQTMGLIVFVVLVGGGAVLQSRLMTPPRTP